MGRKENVSDSRKWRTWQVSHFFKHTHRNAALHNHSIITKRFCNTKINPLIICSADNDGDFIENGLKRCEHIFLFRHWCFFPAKPLGPSLSIHLQRWAETGSSSHPFPPLQMPAPRDFCGVRVQLGSQLLNETLARAC